MAYFGNNINEKYWLTNLIEDTRGYEFYIHPKDLTKLLTYKYNVNSLFVRGYNDPIELFTPIRLAKGKQYIKINTTNIDVYKSEFDRNYYTIDKIEPKDVLGGIIYEKDFKKSDPEVLKYLFENIQNTELSDLIYHIYDINCGYLRNNFGNITSIFYKRDSDLEIFQEEIKMLFAIYGYVLNQNSNYIYYEKYPEYEEYKYNLREKFDDFYILTSEYEIKNSIDNEFLEPNSPFIKDTTFVFYGDNKDKNIEIYKTLIKHSIKNYKSYRVIPENFDQNVLVKINLDYELDRFKDRFNIFYDNTKWYKVKDYDIVYTRDKIKNPNYIDPDKVLIY